MKLWTRGIFNSSVCIVKFSNHVLPATLFIENDFPNKSKIKRSKRLVSECEILQYILWTFSLKTTCPSPSVCCWSLQWGTVISFWWRRRMLRTFWTGRWHRVRLWRCLSDQPESSCRTSRRFWPNRCVHLHFKVTRVAFRILVNKFQDFLIMCNMF